MKILITICARGGSKGIPGKNIKELAGKPLIYYSLKTANDFSKKYNADIALSTDADIIKEVVQNSGYNVDCSYTRPGKLATDSAGKIDAIVDLKEHIETRNHKSYDYVLDLDVTSPLRNVEDLEKALGIMESNSMALNLFSVSPANRNPYFNMVEETGNGFYGLSKKAQFLTRQSAPKVYDLNASFYFYRKDFFEGNHKTVMTDFATIYEMPHICFDLDHPIDFEIMEFLVSQNKLDFQL